MGICIYARACALDSSTYSDPVLQFVMWFSLGLLVLVLSLLLQVTVLRINLIARTAREKRFLIIWRPLMAATVNGKSITLPPLAKADEINFLKLWNHLQEMLRGEAKIQLNKLAIRCGMLSYAHSLLAKKQLRLQLLAINTLGHLEDSSAWDDILRLTRRPDPLVSLAAVRALFQIDADAALNVLQDELLEREDWPVAQIAIQLQELGSAGAFEILAKNADQLAQADTSTGLIRLKRLLSVLEVAPYQHVILPIRHVLSCAKDGEVIAQCLKFMRESNDFPSVLAYLAHADWIVRLQAVRAFGRIGTAEDAPKLLALLSDPVWWVRYRTAQTLLELIRGDMQLVSELRAQLSDRFALDMLDMVIAEKKKQ